MWIIGGCCGFVLVIGLLIMFFSMSLGYKNNEVALRTAIVAKQKDNMAELDNMTKKITQVASVSQEQMAYLKDIIVGNAQARAGNGQGGTLASWIKEAVPNVDTTTFNNLQNIIVASRDGWTMRQKELLDLSREHNKLLQSPISGWFLSGGLPIEVTIVTSTRTEKAFQTGKDDDVEIFHKK